MYTFIAVFTQHVTCTPFDAQLSDWTLSTGSVLAGGAVAYCQPCTCNAVLGSRLNPYHCKGEQEAPSDAYLEEKNADLLLDCLCTSACSHQG